jgi:hypothetical protein
VWSLRLYFTSTFPLNGLVISETRTENLANTTVVPTRFTTRMARLFCKFRSRCTGKV